MMRNKIVSETRAIGMYVFAMSLVITLAAFAYTMLFDVTGVLPVTRICNIIVISASALGIAYAYIASDASQEKHLARTYARRDATVIATMSIYFVTGTTVFGMVVDAMNHGRTIIPMLSEPAIMGGVLILGTSVIAMVILAILDHVAKKELDEIGKREKKVFVKPVPQHVDKVVTSSDTDNAHRASKATYKGISYDPSEINGYIPLTQMGITNIEADEGVIKASFQMRAQRRAAKLKELDIRKRKNRQMEHTKRVTSIKNAVGTVFGTIATVIVTFFGLIFGTVLACGRVVANTISWIFAIIATIVPAIRNGLAVAFSAIASGVSRIVAGIRSFAMMAFSTIADGMSHAAMGIRSFVMMAFSTIADGISHAAMGIRSFAMMAFSTIADGMSHVVAGIRSFAMMAFSTIADGMSHAAMGIRSFTTKSVASTKRFAHEKAPVVREKLDACRDATHDVVMRGKEDVITIADKTRTEVEHALAHLQYANDKDGDDGAEGAEQELPETEGEATDSTKLPADVDDAQGDGAVRDSEMQEDAPKPMGNGGEGNPSMGSCPLPATGGSRPAD